MATSILQVGYRSTNSIRQFARILSGFACWGRGLSYGPTKTTMADGGSCLAESWSPKEARLKFRNEPDIADSMHTASGLCRGYMQANVAMIPSSLADDFEEFCRLNHAACPLLYRSRVGEVGAPPFAKDSDIRTDLLLYVATNFKDGQESQSLLRQLTDFPWEDMVTFYLGCSFSFEDAMLNAGIPIQNVLEKKNVSMYKTNIECIPVGKFSCPTMVVSMRPIKKHLVEKAVAVTAAYEAVHGAPIHIGRPDMIGITDLCHADMGGDSHLDEDDVPVFWACGVTSSLAIRTAKPSLCFSHSPGCMFFSDVPMHEYFKLNKPSFGDDQPKVVVLQEQPYFASVLGTSTLEKINQLEEIIQEDPGNRGICHLHIPSELVKGSLWVSHADSVAMVAAFPVNSSHANLDEMDGLPGVISMARAFQALGKKVTLIASHYNAELLNAAVDTFNDKNILQKGINVETFQVHDGKCSEVAAVGFLFPSGMEGKPRFDVLIATETVCRSVGGGYKGAQNLDLTAVCGKSPIDELFIQANKTNKIVTVGIGDGGNEIGMGRVQDRVIQHITNGHLIAATVPTSSLITAGVSNWGACALAMAVYLLYECPNHSRYRRRGVGAHQTVTLDKVITSIEQERHILGFFVENGLCDGITGQAEMSVDGFMFDSVHTDKLQELMAVVKS